MDRRCGSPAAEARVRMSALLASSSVRWCSALGVVPEDLEVRRRGRHGREAGRHLLAADRARRVGVRRHDPHALDARVVGHQRRHGLGVGTVVVHRHGHHLDAQALEQGEVAVVARHRAHEAHPLLPAPRALGVDASEEHQVDEAVAHHGQARVAARRRSARARPTAARRTSHAARAGPRARRSCVRRRRRVAGRGGQAQQVVGEVELLGRGLAPGQVELSHGTSDPRTAARCSCSTAARSSADRSASAVAFTRARLPRDAVELSQASGTCAGTPGG